MLSIEGFLLGFDKEEGEAQKMKQIKQMAQVSEPSCSVNTCLLAQHGLLLHLDFFLLFGAACQDKLPLKPVFVFLLSPVQRGLLDPEKEDPFSLFVASTNIRYCYYADTHKILGNTYGMLVLQASA